MSSIDDVPDGVGERWRIPFPQVEVQPVSASVAPYLLVFGKVVPVLCQRVAPRALGVPWPTR